MEGSISLETGYAELDIDLSSVEAGPKRATSLRSRSDSLAAPQSQLGLLSRVDLTAPAVFDDAVKQAGFQNGLFPGSLEIFQINIGKLCNMTCRHCHVDAGPDRVEENMDRATVDACLAALDESGAHTVDITGGAPELNPHFEYLVDEAVKRGKHVMDRCNLTVLMLPKLAHLPEWLADRGVEVVCSLPHYRRPNTDRQRGDGTYEKSIEALRRLNRAGYGQGDPKRRLTLVTNPAGASAQLIGVYDLDLVSPIAHVLGELGSDAAFVVHNHDRLDELATTSINHVARLKDGQVSTFELAPEEYGFERSSLSDIRGGDSAVNARITRELLNGARGPRRDTVLLNAAAALVAGGAAGDLREGIGVAEHSIDSGRARLVLEDLIAFTQGAA